MHNFVYDCKLKYCQFKLNGLWLTCDSAKCQIIKMFFFDITILVFEIISLDLVANADKLRVDPDAKSVKRKYKIS